MEHAHALVTFALPMLIPLKMSLPSLMRTQMLTTMWPLPPEMLAGTD